MAEADKVSHIGDEAALKHAQQCTANKERGTTTKPELGASNDGPQDHLGWNPSVGSDPFRNQLRRQFCAEEGKLEDSIAQVVVLSECQQKNPLSLSKSCSPLVFIFSSGRKLSVKA